mmetsp:Transcript_81141/g.160844  ORF Transcript_81141/g.160844 Transcript_81141/m.160844 type:complete len:399 (+) Transcript_81141:51-1247(+)
MVGGEATNATAEHIWGPVWSAVRKNLGRSSQQSSTSLRSYGDFKFPEIPPGVPTVVLAVPFPVTSPAPSATVVLMEEAEVLGIFILAGIVWALPWLCINKRMCCRCFQRWIARRLFCYFLSGLVVNLFLISYVISYEPDVSANAFFFAIVDAAAALSDKLQEILVQCCVIVTVCAVITFRKRILALLGFDHQVVRLDLRDLCTCWAMSRFSVIELVLWRAEDLPPGFSTRSLFVRVVCGANEPHHTRPRDNCRTRLDLRERLQLNYDPDDDTQRLSIIVKQQEIVGAAVAQLAPAAGALAGGLAGFMTPLGPVAGAGVGVVTGVGAANSVGVEIARADFSSAAVNRIRARFNRDSGLDYVVGATPTLPSEYWSERHFLKVDLVPHGVCWLRIHDAGLP